MGVLSFGRLLKSLTQIRRYFYPTISEIWAFLQIKSISSSNMTDHCQLTLTAGLKIHVYGQCSSKVKSTIAELQWLSVSAPMRIISQPKMQRGPAQFARPLDLGV